MEKLKPCQTCNGKAKLVDEFVAGEFYIYCLNCGRHGDIYPTAAAAITAWNWCLKNMEEVRKLTAAGGGK